MNTHYSKFIIRIIRIIRIFVATLLYCLPAGDLVESVGGHEAGQQLQHDVGEDAPPAHVEHASGAVNTRAEAELGHERI